MESHFFRSVVEHSAKACVLRYIYFLKDKSNSGQLTEAQANQLHEDLGVIKKCFSSALKTRSVRIEGYIQYLEDIVTLVRLDFSLSEVQELLQSYVDRYSGEMIEMARLLFDCCLKLRPVCSGYHKSVVEGILGKASSSSSQTTSPNHTPSKENERPASTSFDLESDLLRHVFFPDFKEAASNPG